MNHLFEYWKEIQDRVHEARDLFLFLDYDGTLTTIASRPELAVCPSGVKKLLEILRDLPGVHIAIVSGRSLEDVRRKVGISDIAYVGNHGLEIETPSGRHKKILVPVKKGELQRITQNLHNSLNKIPGILFEDKGPILSIHYRNVPQKFISQVPWIVEAELRHWMDRWKIAAGKMVLEIQPRTDANKGTAVKKLIKIFPSPGLLPIYLGDDQTDEDAFRELRGLGISIYVGPETSASEADFFLQKPGEVQEFLFRCRQARQTVGFPRGNGSG